MHELRILGPPSITASDGRPAASLMRQSKRVALLAYLAAAEPRGAHRRDKLLALFWPESDTSHARSALSQALYVLRGALSDDAVRSTGDDEVALDRRLVWCDAVAFEDHLDGGRPEDALGLYRGDLLDGFFVADAPAFEEWVERQRQRLRQRASRGAWEHAEALASGGATIEAARWARWASELAPADETVARKLMTFLEALGDRAAAIRAYETFTARLAHEFAIAPSVETQRLASSIRGAKAGASAARTSMTAATPTVGRRGPRRNEVAFRAMVAAGALALLGAAAWASLRPPEPGRQPTMHFPLEFATEPLASGIPGSTLALSPDGERLVYVGVSGAGTQLYVRRMDRLGSLPIPHTRGATLPFFSPDGEWLGFALGGTLRRVRLDGGPALLVTATDGKVFGASWGPRDVIAFATAAGLWHVTVGGGTPTSLSRSDSMRGTVFRWPDVLPDGDAVVFTRVDSTGFHLAAVRLDGGAIVPLGIAGTNPRFVAPGHLLYARMDGTLLAAPFDQVALRITGASLPVAEDVFVGGGGGAKLGVSRTGALAYVPESVDRTIDLVDRRGRAERLALEPRAYGDVHFSPDGGRIATTIKTRDEQHDIWMVDVARNALRRVTTDTGSVSPVWTPDGRRVVFATNPGGRAAGFALRSMPIGDGAPAATLSAHEIGLSPGAVTPDGRELLFERSHAASRRDLWIVPMDGGGTARPFLDGPFDEGAPDVAPDGRWVAYTSDESGRQEVYVAAYPHPGRPLRVSSGGGWEPRWDPRGHELFYRTTGGLVAVAVRTDPTLRIDPPRVLFDDTPYRAVFVAAAYDVLPGGERFAMIRRGQHSRTIMVVVNWSEQLGPRRR